MKIRKNRKLFTVCQTVYCKSQVSFLNHDQSWLGWRSSGFRIRVTRETSSFEIHIFFCVCLAIFLQTWHTFFQVFFFYPSPSIIIMLCMKVQASIQIDLWCKKTQRSFNFIISLSGEKRFLWFFLEIRTLSRLISNYSLIYI